MLFFLFMLNSYSYKVTDFGDTNNNVSEKNYYFFSLEKHLYQF